MLDCHLAIGTSSPLERLHKELLQLVTSDLSISQASENSRLQETCSAQNSQIAEAQQALETAEQAYNMEKSKYTSLEGTLRAMERHMKDVQQHSSREVHRTQVNQVARDYSKMFRISCIAHASNRAIVTYKNEQLSLFKNTHTIVIFIPGHHRRKFCIWAHWTWSKYQRECLGLFIEHFLCALDTFHTHVLLLCW